MTDNDQDPERAASLRERAEARVRIGAEQLHEMPRERVADLVHELTTHQIELEIQNEELRTAQDELVEARDRYQNLYDLAPIGYVTTSAKGLVLDANLTLCDMLQIERGKLIKQPLSRFIESEDQEVYFRSYRALTEPGQRGSCELRLRLSSGDTRWVRLDSVVQLERGRGSCTWSTISDISQRHLAESKVAAALEEKELLLREVHHRVKNNMQVIVSLLRLQSLTITDPDAVEAFTRCEVRVRSLAMVHEKLLRSDDLSVISCEDFISDLVPSLADAFEVDGSSLTVDVGDVTVGLDVAVPLGLIVTELVSNALNHAFPDNREPAIAVSLQPLGDRGEVMLTVSDSGVGMTEQRAAGGAESFGLNLVARLAEDQLGGRLEISSSSSGTTIRIPFQGGARGLR